MVYLIGKHFIQSGADSCVYVRKTDKDNCVILIIWVDDIIVAASNTQLLDSVKETLSTKFKMKDLGQISWFIGTEFNHDTECIKMTPTQYIDKILSRFKMRECKPILTPCNPGINKAGSPESELADASLYRAIVGSLIYLMTGTRPDLCYIVTKLYYRRCRDQLKLICVWLNMC